MREIVQNIKLPEVTGDRGPWATIFPETKSREI